MWNAFCRFEKKPLMSKNIRLGILVLIIPFIFSFTIAHKFYLSVTEVNYSEKDQSIQMLSRIFIDDLESVLEERYEKEFNLSTSEELKDANQYIERYLKSRIGLEINNKNLTFSFLGKEYDNDVVKCYLEVSNVDLDTIKSIKITNTTFFEFFEEQQNIIHFKFEKHKKSFILIKGNDKGVLNF